MNALLSDLLAHREGADAVQLRAIVAHQRAAADPAIVRRVHHMAEVQRHFLSAIGANGPGDALPAADGVSSVGELLPHVQATHAFELAHVRRLDDAALDEWIDIPFPQSALRITRTQALTQSAMHGQHHRAQNATRLRELGGVPPTTDLILWYWLQRPAASWEALA